MRKNFPLDMTEKFIGNNGNKYFLKDNNYKKSTYFDNKKSNKYPYYKHILPEQLQDENITIKDNIVCPLIVDTEFTAYNGDINKLSIDKLKKLRNRQLIQLDRIDYLNGISEYEQERKPRALRVQNVADLIASDADQDFIFRKQLLTDDERSPQIIIFSGKKITAFIGDYLQIIEVVLLIASFSLLGEAGHPF